MELKDYISETIYQISLGVKESIDKCKFIDSIVNPDITFGQNNDFFISPGSISSVKRRVQFIEMDIAVTVTEKETNGIGAKVCIPILNIDGDSKGETNTSNTNKVKFTIPICLPTSKVKEL